MSPRNETVKQCRRQMTVANSPVQLFIFGIFEHKWGTRKHIDDLKNYSWCIPVQKEIKPIIWGAAITPEPWNRQQCWFIFEDPNVRVARLLRPRDNKPCGFRANRTCDRTLITASDCALLVHSYFNQIARFSVIYYKRGWKSPWWHHQGIKTYVKWVLFRDAQWEIMLLLS